MITIYVTIGNSDNKLTQSEWADFVDAVLAEVLDNPRIPVVHGVWFSVTHSRYQNACLGFDMEKGLPTGALRNRLREIAREFKQDSIAWAEADVEMLWAARHAAATATPEGDTR